MDDRKPNVVDGSVVVTVSTRAVGNAWATRSLGIALALCMCLTVGGDLSVGAVAAVEPWSGILDPSRAVDWSQAGIPGGIPNRTTICASLDPGATYTQINTAIAACTNGVVYLNAGTYSLSGGITFEGTSNVTLRGAGPDQTILQFTGTDRCGGLSAN